MLSEDEQLPGSSTFIKHLIFSVCCYKLTDPQASFEHPPMCHARWCCVLWSFRVKVCMLLRQCAALQVVMIA